MADARQKFTDLQTEYADLIAHLRKCGIKATVFVWEDEPNTVRIRGVGKYRNKKWMQEQQMHKFVAVTPAGWQAAAEFFHQTAEEQWKKKYAN